MASYNDVTTQPATVMISLIDFPSKTGTTYELNVWYIPCQHLKLTRILIC